MVRHARVALLSLALGALLTGCGRSGPGPNHGGDARALDETPLEPPPELLSLLPEESYVVLRADMVQVRESAYYEAVVSLLQGYVGAVGGLPVDLVGILSRTDEAVAALVPPDSAGGEPEVVLLLRGRYEEGELEGALRAIEADAAQSGGQPAPMIVLERGEHRVLTMEGLAMFALGAHTWLATVPGRVDQLLARVDGLDAGRGPRSSRTFAALASQVGFDTAPVGVVVEVSPELRALLMAEAGQGDRLEAAVLESIVGGAARVTFDQGIELDGLVETTNPLVAAAAADLLEEAFASLSQQGLVAGLVSNHQLRVEGPRALVTVRAADTDVRASIGSLAALITLVTALSEEPPPEDPPEDQQGVDQGASPPAGQGPPEQ